jgi:nucleotide-binding universal stress UspA family protein
MDTRSGNPLTLPGAEACRMTAHKIVVGVDGSEHSARAVKWCARYALMLDAEVLVVHVVERPAYATGMYTWVQPPVALTPARREEIRDSVARDWCKPLSDAGAAYRVLVIEGYPTEALMQVAQHENADLVVTGRRGLGGFKEMLVGSTCHALSHHLDRPLVIVP